MIFFNKKANFWEFREYIYDIIYNIIKTEKIKPENIEINKMQHEEYFSIMNYDKFETNYL